MELGLKLSVIMIWLGGSMFLLGLLGKAILYFCGG